MPGSLLSRYSPVPGRSVPFCCVTRYCSGESFRIASSLLVNFRISFSLDVYGMNVEPAPPLRCSDRFGGVVPSAGPALLRQGREAGAELLGTFRAHVEVFGRPPERLRDGLAGGDEFGVARRVLQPVVA